MILLVKEYSLRNLVWFDRLCQGLVSWSTFNEKIDDDASKRMLYLFSPSHSKLKWGFLWINDKGFPWKKLEKLNLKNETIYWTGKFNTRELRRGKELFPKLKQWDESL